MTPVAVELFAGCGGFSTGALDAGCKVATGFDLDARSVEAFEYNHAYRGSKGVRLDLSKASGDDILKLSGVDKVDLLLGGPPCQPFSIVGKRKGMADDRGNLIFEFARLVDELEPTAFIFENVPNLGAIEDGLFLNQLQRKLAKSGYKIATQIVMATDYGVAQVRKRLVILGLRRAVPKLAAPTHGTPTLLQPNIKPILNASDVLSDLPPAGEFEECGIYNHEPTVHTEQMVERLSRLPQGKREKGSFHDRLHPERPSYTLRAGTGNFSPLRPIHYDDDRVITVRESARIQGFSDDFIWPDWIPRLQQYRQVGNAVPPPVAKALVTGLAKQCGWTLRPRSTKGDASKRGPAITMDVEHRVAERRKRLRGASLGKAQAS